MNQLNPLIQEWGSVILGLFSIILAVFAVMVIAVKYYGAEKYKTFGDAAVSSIMPFIFSVVTVLVIAVVLYLASLIVSIVSFSWEFVGWISVASFIFWTVIAIKSDE